MAGTHLCGGIGERAPSSDTHRTVSITPAREAPVVGAKGAFKVRVCGDGNRISLRPCDITSQQPDDSWASRAKLERPEHAERDAYLRRVSVTSERE